MSDNPTAEPTTPNGLSALSEFLNLPLTGPIALALGVVLFVYLFNRPPEVKKKPTETPSEKKPASKLLPTPAAPPKSTSIMSPPNDNLLPPKSDPITPAELAQYNGSDPSKPIYVAIKGNVYDVSAKKEMYGAGAGYNVFAGKDASRGLGMSSLDPKDAVADYSGLNEAHRKTLDGWETFFQKRYNIVGKVTP